MKLAIHALVLGALACAHPPRADSYLRALAEGRCAEAYEQLSPAFRAKTNREAFCASVSGVTYHPVALVQHGGQWWVEPAGPVRTDAQTRAATEVLRKFARAAMSGDFATVHAMLAAPLRARYTPERLRADFSRARAIAEARVLALAAADAVVDGDVARAGAGAGRMARLVREESGWKVASLE